MSEQLHSRLIAKQSDEELERKARKAVCYKSKMWTQEELDAADREAKQLLMDLRGAILTADPQIYQSLLFTND